MPVSLCSWDPWWGHTVIIPYLLCPNLKEDDGSYRFRVVRPSVRASVRQEPCMLGFWNFIYGFLMEKYLTHFIFSCPSYLPSWSYAPLNKIRMKSDACHILWTVHARVLKFHIWVPHVSCPSYLPLCRDAPLKKSQWNLVSKISRKSIWAWGLKLGQLIRDDE